MPYIPFLPAKRKRRSIPTVRKTAGKKETEGMRKEKGAERRAAHWSISPSCL